MILKMSVAPPMQYIRISEGRAPFINTEARTYMLLVPEESRIMVGVEKIMLEFSDKQTKTLISHGRLNELGEIMIKENAVSVLMEYFV